MTKPTFHLIVCFVIALGTAWSHEPVGPDDPLSVKHAIRSRDKTRLPLHFDCKIDGDSCTVVLLNDSQKPIAITDGPASERVKVFLETREERNHGWAGLCDALHALHVVVRSHKQHKWTEIDISELNGSRGRLVVDLSGGVLHEGVYSEFELQITIQRGKDIIPRQGKKTHEKLTDASSPSDNSRSAPSQPAEGVPPAKPEPER